MVNVYHDTSLWDLKPALVTAISVFYLYHDTSLWDLKLLVLKLF